MEFRVFPLCTNSNRSHLYAGRNRPVERRLSRPRLKTHAPSVLVHLGCELYDKPESDNATAVSVVHLPDNIVHTLAHRELHSECEASEPANLYSLRWCLHCLAEITVYISDQHPASYESCKHLVTNK